MSYQTSAFRLLTFVVTFVGVAHWFGGDPVRSVSPPRQVLQLTAFAAEGPPDLIDRMATAEHAERLRHGAYSIGDSTWAGRGVGAGRSRSRAIIFYPPAPPDPPAQPVPLSAAWCRTSFARTMKITSSATFVAWSPIRSRWRETRIRSSAGSIVAGSCSM